jgi:hypothetical protein
MALTTMDALVSALASADQDIMLYWPSGTTVAGGYTNLNRLVTGSAFGQAAIPTAASSGGHVPTDVPPGYATINAGAGTLYIARMAASCATACTIMVYDRVWACSGFSGTSTTAQAVTTPVALPSLRAPGDGEGLEMWLESYTAIGATASNVTVSYTNSASVASRTTVQEAITASFPAGRVQRLRLQDGDTGVKSIQSLTLSANSGTAGNFGITLLERKCMIPLMTANIGNVMDFASLGLPEIQPDAALQFIHLGTTTTTGVIMGSFNIVAG